MKFNFFLLLASIFFATHSYAAGNINVGQVCRHYYDSRGDYNIIFLTIVNEQPVGGIWMKQKYGKPQLTSSKDISTLSARAIKAVADLDSIPALEAIEPKEDEAKK